MGTVVGLATRGGVAGGEGPMPLREDASAGARAPPARQLRGVVQRQAQGAHGEHFVFLWDGSALGRNLRIQHGGSLEWGAG